MTNTRDTVDPRPGRIAANLHISRATARGLLGVPRDTRRELLAHVSRVDSHAALRWLERQPTVAPV